MKLVCPECGAADFLGLGPIVGVWEDIDDYGEQVPDWVGCKDCNFMSEYADWVPEGHREGNPEVEG